MKNALIEMSGNDLRIYYNENDKTDSQIRHLDTLVYQLAPVFNKHFREYMIGPVMVVQSDDRYLYAAKDVAGNIQKYLEMREDSSTYGPLAMFDWYFKPKLDEIEAFARDIATTLGCKY